MTVIDASALVALLTSAAMAGRDDLVTVELRAPTLLSAEIMSALRGLNLSGQLSDETAWRAWEFYRSMRITRHPLELTADRAWQLRHQFTTYDAHYIALAELYDEPLLTSDKKLLTGHFAEVNLLTLDD